MSLSPEVLRALFSTYQIVCQARESNVMDCQILIQILCGCVSFFIPQKLNGHVQEFHTFVEVFLCVIAWLMAENFS